MPLRTFRGTSAPMIRQGIMAILLLLPLLFATPASGWAQAASSVQLAQASSDAGTSSAHGASTLDEADLKDLVSTLEDDQKRTEFVKTLKSALAAQEQQKQTESEQATLGSALVEAVSGTLGRAADQIATLAAQVALVPQGLLGLRHRLDSASAQHALLIGVIKALAVLALGTAARLLVRWLLGPLRRRLMTSIVASRRWDRWPMMILHLFLEIIPPVIMTAVAWVALPLVHASGVVRLSITGLVGAIALLRGVLAAGHAVFYPSDRHARMLPISDETAHYLMVWLRRLATVGILGYFAISIAGLLGLRAASAIILLKILALVIAALLIVFIMQNRHTVAAALRKGTGQPPQGRSRRLASQHIRQRLADIWHILASLYVAAAFFIWISEVQGGFLFMARATILSAIVVIIGALVTQAIHALIRRAFAISHETAQRFPGLERRANRYIPLFETTVRTIIGCIGVLALMQVWGLNALSWFSGGVGERLISGLITIAVVLVFALVVWELSSAWIERYFSTTDTDGNLLERSARARTLLPLARNVLVIVLGIVVVLTILSELGVNIAPLLAGAGVVGLAIGFGSQKLVQDVITGAFMLIEDTVSVGDVVETGGHSGVVEGLSIRSLRLRDVAGSVHTIPFSTVDTVVNMTKDYSYYVLNVGVAYREDTDFVCEVMTEVATELAKDSEFSSDILDALEINGVDQLADSAVIIRARIKTKPIQQWRVGREYNRRMKKAFDHYGIEIPFPHQTIYFGEDRDGNAPPMHLRVERPARRSAPIQSPNKDDRPELGTDESPTTPPEQGPPSPGSATGALPD